MTCAKKAPGVAAAIKAALPGSGGFVLVEYRGTEKPQLESRTTEAIYTFCPGAVRYVDVFDVGMLSEYQPDGEQVFFEVE